MAAKKTRKIATTNGEESSSGEKKTNVAAAFSPAQIARMDANLDTKWGKISRSSFVRTVVLEALDTAEKE